MGEPERATIELFQERLMKWYQENRRFFSWRVDAHPYRVLIAELMLQRTQARQVDRAYVEFMKLFPDVHALAASPVQDIRQAIRPLGLGHRAETTKKMAATIVERHRGEVPDRLEDLLQLPGVGPYIAHAVLAHAFVKDVVAVDANVVRVLQRVFDVRATTKRARSDRSIWAFAQTLVPVGCGSDFNLALLDFASVVCSAKEPQHEMCPLCSTCAAYRRTRGETG